MARTVSAGRCQGSHGLAFLRNGPLSVQWRLAAPLTSHQRPSSVHAVRTSKGCQLDQQVS